MNERVSLELFAWFHAGISAAAAFLGIWFGFVGGNVIDTAFLHSHIAGGSAGLALGLIFGALTFRRLRLKSQVARWGFYGLLTSFSLMSIGQAAWDLTDHMGIGLFLGLLFGIVSSMIAAGWPFAGTRYDPAAPRILNWRVPVTVAALVLGLTGWTANKGIMFFHPQLMPLITADLAAIALIGGAAAVLVWAVKAAILKWADGRISPTDLQPNESLRSVYGIFGIVLSSVAAAFFAGTFGPSAFLFPVAGYAVFEYLPHERWETARGRSSKSLFLGFLVGSAAMLYVLIFTGSPRLALLTPAAFSLAGYAIGGLWHRLQRPE